MRKLTCLVIFVLLTTTFVYNINANTTGVNVRIKSPEDGIIFHHRNISIHGTIYACCKDMLVSWNWIWSWQNGSHNENYSLYQKQLDFSINISLYPGANNVSVYAEGSSGAKGSDRITLYYDGPVANANGPYKGRDGEIITFHGSAYGGYKPYNWSWNFGDGSYAYEQNPQHQYAERGIYNVSLTVTDSKGYIDINNTYIIIGEKDNIPPEVEIIEPSHGIYINDRKIIPFLFTIIIGNATIEVYAHDNEGISSVAFYIDEQLKFNDTIAPYRYILKNKIGFHKIKAVAYDLSMNYNTDAIRVISI